MLTKKQVNKIKKDLSGEKSRIPVILGALGDPGRFKIFSLLVDNSDICVTDVAHVFGITVSAASQQLRVLERLGLVLRTRMGQMVCYEINYDNSITKQLVKLFMEVA